MIPESRFAGLYHSSQGRSNVPVAILVSLSVLKERFDLTDEALMGSFQFDLRFQYGLGLTLEGDGDDTAHLGEFSGVSGEIGGCWSHLRRSDGSDYQESRGEYRPAGA
ncbi:MAG: transposase [Magnetococcales bacterium]|nr:transposase [Magnetococcales bacterium]